MSGHIRRSARGISDAQLAWTHRNRQRSDRTRSLDEVVQAAGVDGADSDSVARAVFEAIDAVVDDDFRRNCTLGEASRGQVLLLVEASQFMYNANWNAVLLRHLQRAVPRGKIKRIVFRQRDADECVGAVFHTPGC